MRCIYEDGPLQILYDVVDEGGSIEGIAIEIAIATVEIPDGELFDQIAAELQRELNRCAAEKLAQHKIEMRA